MLKKNRYIQTLPVLLLTKIRARGATPMLEIIPVLVEVVAVVEAVAKKFLFLLVALAVTLSAVF